MQFQPMRIFGLLLFVSTPIFMLLGVINSFATSSGLARAVSFFEVIALGSLAMMIGLAIACSVIFLVERRRRSGLPRSSTPLKDEEPRAN